MTQPQENLQAAPPPAGDAPRRAGSKRRRGVFPALALMMGLLIGGGVAEAAFRFYLWRNFSTMTKRGPGVAPKDPNKVARLHELLYPHPNLRISYKFLPNINCVANLNDIHKFPLRTDSMGFRGPELAREKPERTFRILGLGDSSMWGWGLPEADTFIRLLRAALERAFPERRFEILNTAAPGYNTVIESEIFKELGPDWGWDLVLVHFDLNDSATPGFLQVPKNFARLDHLYLADLPGYLFGAWYSPKRFIDNALREFGSGERPAEGGPRVNPPGEVSPEIADMAGWDNLVKAYADIADRCRQTRVPLRVFMVPISIFENDPKAERDPDYDKVKSMLDGLGVEWIDVFRTTRPHGLANGLNTQDFWIIPNGDSHPNRLRSVLTALALYDNIYMLAAEKLAVSPEPPDKDPGRRWLMERLAEITAEQKARPRIPTTAPLY